MMEYHSVYLADHSRLRATLAKIHTDLSNAKKFQDVYLKKLKDEVKPLARYHQDLLMNGIPKSKQLYYKKSEIEREMIEKNSDKIYKAGKEVEQSEHAYRTGIVHLENARRQLFLMRNHAIEV
jgi:hypothetical protein